MMDSVMCRGGGGRSNGHPRKLELQVLLALDTICGASGACFVGETQPKDFRNENSLGTIAI